MTRRSSPNFALRLRWHVAGRGRARYRDQDELNAPSIPNPKLGLAAKTTVSAGAEDSVLREGPSLTLGALAVWSRGSLQEPGMQTRRAW